MIRGLLSLALILSLGLASLGFGMARGQAPAAGGIVICTGNGIVTITVDADGNPTESHTLCPDAALAFWAALATPQPLVEPAVLVPVARAWPRAAAVAHARLARNRSARAPPV